MLEFADGRKELRSEMLSRLYTTDAIDTALCLNSAHLKQSKQRFKVSPMSGAVSAE